MQRFELKLLACCAFLAISQLACAAEKPRQFCPPGDPSGCIPWVAPTPPANDPDATALSASAHEAILYEEPVEGAGADAAVTAIEAAVNWRFVGDGPNGPEVEASLEVPERNMTIRFSLHKNGDDTLPASHLVEVVVDTPADFPGQSIGSIPRIVLKPTEGARGQPLVGAAAKVADGFFWIALSAVEADIASNLSLMRDRNWIDLPFVYENGQRAILTFEKGPDGEAAFQQAFAAWESDIPPPFAAPDFEIPDPPTAAVTPSFGSADFCAGVEKVVFAGETVSVSVCTGELDGQRAALVDLSGELRLGTKSTSIARFLRWTIQLLLSRSKVQAETWRPVSGSEGRFGTISIEPSSAAKAVTPCVHISGSPAVRGTPRLMRRSASTRLGKTMPARPKSVRWEVRWWAAILPTSASRRTL